MEGSCIGGKNVSRLTTSTRERPFQLSDLDADQKKEYLPNKMEAQSGLVDQCGLSCNETGCMVKEENDVNVRGIFISSGRVLPSQGAFEQPRLLQHTRLTCSPNFVYSYLKKDA